MVLADDGIIDLVAVEIAAHGTQPVALTRAERYLAAARIIARGGTIYLIAKRLHGSGTTAGKPAERCEGAPAGTAQGLGPAFLQTGTWSGIATGICTGTTPQVRGQLRQQQARPPGTPGPIVGAAGGQR
jgi:hypothetical protein